MTLGVAGFVVLLALAMPAFEATQGDWRNRGNFAVTFLDRYGNVIGHRGIIHENSVPVDELPDYFVKAVLATEDRRFFDHFGIDVVGLFRARHRQCAGRRRRPGRLDADAAAGQERVPHQRAFDRAQDQGSLPGDLARSEPFEEGNPQSLYLDRTYMGGGTFGAAAAAQYYFGKSITDVNLAEAAMLAGLFKAPTKYAPQRQPAGGARPRQRRAHQPRPERLHDRGPGDCRAAQSRDRRSTAPRSNRPISSSTGPSTRCSGYRPRFPGALADRPHHDRHGPAEGGRGRDRDQPARLRRTATAPSRAPLS